MKKLTPNLSREEFSCNCGCGFNAADYELVLALQAACDYFGNHLNSVIWIEITGPNRCYQWNLHEEGSEDSKHLWAMAADIKLFRAAFINGRKKKGDQIPADLIAGFFEENYKTFGIGRYSNRTHIDSRATGAARWKE